MPILSASFRRPRLRLALAIVFAAATLLYGALWMVAVRAAPDVELGYQGTYLPAERAQLVTSVQPNSPAERCGMRPGDHLVAIDGERLADINFQTRIWFHHEPGNTVRLTIRRPGETAPSVLACAFRRTSSTSTEGGMAAYVAGQVRNSYPVPFVLVGLTVLFLRLDDPKAWLLALLCAAFAATPGFPDSIDAVAPALRPFARAYQATFLSLLAPSFYLFFAVFPARSPVDRRLPWLKWVTFAVAVAVAIPGLRAGGMRPPPPLPRLLGASLANQIVVYWALAILAVGLVSLAANYLRPPDAETRRKTRVIVWGTAIGLTPNLIDAGVRNATGLQDPDWLATLLVLFAFLIPLSFAYAVVKHRVLEIPVLLKRSARYLLVQRGFTILLALASMAVTLAFALSLAPSLAPLVEVARPSGIALGAVFGTVLLWGGTQIHRRVSERIDRAFFRRAYDARMILQELADRTRAATGRTELAALLHRHVGDALQPSALAVYFREQDDRLTAMAGAVPEGLEVVSATSPALTRLAEHGWPVEVSPQPAGGAPNAHPLAPLDPDCLVPMVGRDRRLLGLLVLGPRLSEEPYSGEDVRLLALVAGQAALALENLSLAEQMADRLEADRRQAHEVAIAQEVQQKLLPQRMPPLETLDYAGACTQARIVGGDYYDFLDLGPGRVGFVLADISGKGIAGTPRTQKVTSHVSDAVRVTRRRGADPVGRSGWNGDAVADQDRVLADEHLLDDQAHDALALENVERVRGHAQPREKSRERLRQAQVRRALLSLFGDRVQLGPQRLLTLTQQWHALPQLVQGHEVFLIGREHPLDAFPNPSQIPLDRVFALLCGVGRTSDGEPTIKFLLNQGGIFEQAHDLSPDDLIQQILAHGSVLAAGTSQVAPCIRADAAIVVDLACARTSRRAGKCISAPAAAHQTLYETRLDRASPRPYFVLVQQFLRARKGVLGDERRHRDLDPFLARPLVVSTVAAGHSAAQAQRARHTLARGHAGLPETGRAAICRVAQHGPDHGALPPGTGLARGHTLVVEPAGDRPDAPARRRVPLIDLPHHARLGLDHRIRGGRFITLAEIAIAVRGAAQDADFARSRPVTLPAPRALKNLCAFILSDHALKLDQKLILGRCALRGLQKPRFHAVTGELFDQQDLIGVLATQAIGRVHEHGLDLPFGRQVAHPLQAWPLERGPAIPVVLENPGPRHLEIEGLRQLGQRRGLARNRVCLALLRRGHSGVDRGHRHAQTPLQWPQVGGLGPEPKSRTRERACWPGVDQMRSRAQPATDRDGLAAQPRGRRTAPRNAASARVTIWPSVRPLRRAYARKARTVLTGSLKVTATVRSTAGTGAPSAAACSR